jgi:hypothetical protein
VSARRVLAAACALACAALAAGTPATAQAQRPEGVGFAASQPLTVSWSEVDKGRYVDVCNGSAHRLTKLDAVPVEFKFVLHGTPVGTATLLAAKPPTHGIPAGSCAAVLLHARSFAQPDPGEYAGALVLVARDGGLAERSLVVDVLESKPATPAPVVTPLTLSIANATPWARHADATLLLQAPKAGEEPLAAGQSCSANSAPAKHECPLIGVLYHDGNTIGVTVAGPATYNENRHVQELPVELSSDGHAVGTYEGAVTLAGSGGTPQTIKLKVNQTDAWYCALIALLIGAGISVLTQLNTGRLKPKAKLEERREALAKAYVPAHASGHRQVKIDPNEIARYADGVREAIAHYAQSTGLFNSKDPAYEEIDKTLRVAEADAAVLTGEDGLGKALSELADEIGRVTELLQSSDVADEPTLLGQAAELLSPALLGVGGASARDKRAKELTPLLKQWRKLAHDVFLNAVWLSHLANPDDPNAKVLNEQSRAVAVRRDKKALVFAGAELLAARSALLAAETTSDLEQIRGSHELRRARGTITYLGSEYDVPAPTSLSPPVAPRKTLWRIGYKSSAGTAPTEEQVFENNRDGRVRAAKPVELPVNRALLALDVLGLLVTVSGAIIAGLGVFYFGKSSFGTTADYLTVLLAGTAAQLVAKAILTQLPAFTQSLQPDLSFTQAKLK